MDSTLSSIDLRDSANLTEIGSFAFWGTYLLTANFNNYSSLTVLGDYAFGLGYSLWLADFSGCTSLTVMGDGLFHYSVFLVTANFSGCTSLTNIGLDSFMGTVSLVTVDFTGCASLYKIENNTFSTSINLERVHVAGCNSLVAIEDFAFARKSTSIFVNQMNAYFNDNTFVQTPDLTFRNQTSALREFDFHRLTSLRTIGYAAFFMTNLTVIRFPKSLESVGAYAFAGITSLKSVCFEGDLLPHIDPTAFIDSSVSIRDIKSCYYRRGIYHICFV